MLKTGSQFMSRLFRKEHSKMKLSSQLATIAMASMLLVFSHLGAQGSNALGIDVSQSQGSINWPSVHGCGVQFAFAKSSEGVSYQDSRFAANMVNGKAAGLQMGAYHFARPDINCPGTEANYFWSVAGPYIIADGKSLFPAVDFEIFNGHVCVANYTAWFNTWAAKVKTHTSHFLHPVLIVGCGGACAMTSAATLESWIIDPVSPWNSCSCCNWIDPCTANGWTYWNFSSTGAICGISGNCDLDQFNGTLATLKSTQGVK
jgi:lysozyme